MKATGIVRRIDELGRVVIPKEIRRTLRIRQGDPLEIFTDRDGEVILKKYSPIGELGEFATEYAEALYKTLGHTTLICDRDSVVAAFGPGRKEFADKMISPQLETAMQRRTPLVVGEGDQPVMIVRDEEPGRHHAQLICPIISEGEAAGAVMLLSSQPSVMFSEADLKVAQVAAGFLGKQMEQ